MGRERAKRDLCGHRLGEVRLARSWGAVEQYASPRFPSAGEELGEAHREYDGLRVEFKGGSGGEGEAVEYEGENTVGWAPFVASRFCFFEEVGL